MANPMRGEATFIADDATYVISMNADALCMAESVTGKPISTVIALFDSGGHLGMTSALAWAGMFRQYGFPYDGFADRVMAWGLPVVREAISAAMRHAWPEKDDDENPPKRGRAKKTAGTGSSS